jgi:hypothetical protein
VEGPSNELWNNHTRSTIIDKSILLCKCQCLIDDTVLTGLDVHAHILDLMEGEKRLQTSGVMKCHLCGVRIVADSKHLGCFFQRE